MQSESDKITEFLNKLYRDFLDETVYIIVRNANNPETGEDLIIAEFQKKIIIVTLCLKRIYLNDLHAFFCALPMNRPNVFTLLSSHCFKMCEKIDNIYLAFLYTCSFVHFTLGYCEQKDFLGFKQLIEMCTKEIFVHAIQKSFDSQGGWEALHNFSMSNNLPEILDFIHSIYTMESRLFTVKDISQQCFDYQFRKDVRFEQTKTALKFAERVTSYTFRSQFEKNPGYSNEVKRSFTKLRTTLDEQCNKNSSPQVPPTLQSTAKLDTSPSTVPSASSEAK